MNIAKIQEWAQNEMNKHLPSNENWTFRFSRADKRVGTCLVSRNRYTGEVLKREIAISKKHCLESPIEEVKDTILHEIAHAMVGNHHGHNHIWKEACRKIGAKPEQFVSPDELKMKFKYYLVHPALKRIVSRSNKTTKWVKYPEHFSIKSLPSSKGNLKVMSHNEVAVLGLV